MKEFINRQAELNCVKCPHIHPDNGNCTTVGGFCTAVPAAHCPWIPELREELARVTAERDAAQLLIAEHLGVVGVEKVTTCFGYPLDRVLALVLADRDGRLIIRQDRQKEETRP